SAFAFFVLLLGVAGVGVSVFKVGALALIGDVSRSTREHTSFMNTVEGFFGVGAIAGPAIVATLLAAGMSWKYLYVLAAVICGALIVTAAAVRYPPTRMSSPTQTATPTPTPSPVPGHTPAAAPAGFGHTLTMLRN